MARDLDTRFSSKVDRSGPHHLWLGSINQQRVTSQIKADGRIVTAHRVAWELQRGPVPADQRVRTCPAVANCVNVDHLSLAGGWSSSDPHDRRTTSAGSSRRRRRGGGSIRERSPGVWELSVVAGSDEQGGPVRAFRTIRGTESEATKALALFVAEVMEAGPIVRNSGAGHLTVDRLLQEFLQHLDVDKGRRPATLLRYDGLQQNWIRPTPWGQPVCARA